MAVIGLNGTPGLSVGVPLIVVGKPGRSTPVFASNACMYQCGCWASGPSLTFDVKYTAPVTGSYTGVAVIPMFGFRSPQPTVAAGHAAPAKNSHFLAPVTASRP